MSETLYVKKIDGRTFFSDTATPCIFIIGRSGSGKSTMMRDLLFNYKNRRDNANGVKGAVIMPKDGGIRDTGGYAAEYRDPTEIHDFSSHPKGSFLAFDDTKYDTAGIVCLARRLALPSIMTINVVEYPGEMPTLCEHLPVRAPRIDFFCIFADRSMYVEELRVLYAVYVKDVFPSFGAFYAILSGLCNATRYECLVVRTRRLTSLNMADNVFWYRADRGLAGGDGDDWLWTP